MLKKVPPIYQKRDRPIRTKPVAPPAPGVLTLIAATYEPGESVTLTFDRAIDLGEVRVDRMRLNDATADSLYSGSDPFAVGADAVRVTLSYEGDSTGPSVRLTAPATVLILPADGGPAWAGVSGLTLPFG